MEPKAEKVVQNIGAVAETVSVFYNSMARQVPKDVAVELTKHFMNITISRRSVPNNAAAIAAAAEIQKRILQQRQQEKAAQEAKAQDPAPEEPAQEEK